MTPTAAGAVDAAFWPRVAEAAARWLAGCGAAPRDAVLLLPHAGLLGPARAAFAARGGWQPRIETADTLALSLAPPVTAAAGMLSGDRVADRLQACELLRGSVPGDARLFRSSVVAFVETAQALHRASALQAPAARALWWDALRQALGPMAGPGASERKLARMAVEWAAAAPAPATDAVRALKPAAWIVVSAAGIDPGVFLTDDGTPRLDLRGDEPAKPFDAAAALPAPQCIVATGLEVEAQAAALAVIDALDAGAASVALVAQDRLLARRVRALLERVGEGVDDESGWALSTTRAAAGLMAWLRAARGHGRDVTIEALRAEGAPARAVDALELKWRRDRQPEEPRVRTMLDEHAGRVAAWRPREPRVLGAWLRSLRECAPRLIEQLAADAAGRQVLDTLGLTQGAQPPWARLAEATRMDLPQFIAWVDDALEGSVWRPSAASGARVRFVPLARAPLRPFDAVVFPGCDAMRLGGAAAAPLLLAAPIAQEFGIADGAQRRARETLALAQVLRAPRLTLLRRAYEGNEPLAQSPLLERAWLARRRAGAELPVWREAQLRHVDVALAPIARPAPTMVGAMPPALSASSLATLRDCPYRFFAQAGLNLVEGDELDGEIEQRDYGEWLHGVLHRFHTSRTGNDDAGELRAAAQAEELARGLDAAQLLPYVAAFDEVAERYLDWLAAHEREGWRFEAGELSRSLSPAALGGSELKGRIDRIDTSAGGMAMLIDYKTGARNKLTTSVKQGLEDTQLCVYAALLPEPQDLRAAYLSLHDREAPKLIEHVDVASSVELFLEGIGADLQALREGAGAPALGEGATCEHCPARGLCRRDHWTR